MKNHIVILWLYDQSSLNTERFVKDPNNCHIISLYKEVEEISGWSMSKRLYRLYVKISSNQRSRKV
jgi:hypothetical protein